MRVQLPYIVMRHTSCATVTCFIRDQRLSLLFRGNIDVATTYVHHVLCCRACARGWVQGVALR